MSRATQRQTVRAFIMHGGVRPGRVESRFETWRERSRERRKYQLQLFPMPGRDPAVLRAAALNGAPVGPMTRVVGALLLICPAIRRILVVKADHPHLVLRVSLAWWTWLGLGLIHWQFGRTVVLYRYIWAPPNWRIEVIVA